MIISESFKNLNSPVISRAQYTAEAKVSEPNSMFQNEAPSEPKFSYNRDAKLRFADENPKGSLIRIYA